MPAIRDCGICLSDDRLIIEAALLQAPLRAIEKQFGFDKSMLHRHKTRHLVGQTAYLAERRQTERTKVILDASREAIAKIEGTRATVTVSALETPDDVLTEMRRLYANAVGILLRAENLGDSRLAVRAMKEAREQLQLFGRAFKMFDEGGTTIDRSTKVLTMVGGMSEGDLRSFLTGQGGVIHASD